MPALNVSSAIRINASPAAVKDVLTDFNTWPIWSPWLYIERDASVTYHGTPHEPGHGYDWVGQQIGSGGMNLQSATDSRVNASLEFLKPFKSSASVYFDLTPVGDDATDVVWGMDSQLPFFMFFMKDTMGAMIRSDYERGLRMLKDYLEAGRIDSRTVSAGIVDIEPFEFVGVSGECRLADIAKSVDSSFAAIAPVVKTAGVNIQGAALTQYQQFNIKHSHCRYIAGFEVENSDINTGDGSLFSIPACRALKLTHTGSYRHLSNGWNQGISELRGKKLKGSRHVHQFERYLNDPDDTQEHDLITEIYLPIR